MKKESKIIGRGSYGCVIRPNLACDDIKASSKTIGKLFDRKRYFNSEVEHLEGNMKIKTCSMDLENVPRGIVKGCRMDFDDEVHQLVQDFKGKDLQKIIIKAYEEKGRISHRMFQKFFFLMLEVVDALIKIESQKKQHMDIKLDNILYDGKHLTLIDFGLVSYQNEIYTKKKERIRDFFSVHQPPEFKPYIESLYKQYDEILPAFQKLEMMQQFKPYTGKHVTNKVDVFELGYCILELYIHSEYAFHTFKRVCKNSLFYDNVKQLIRNMMAFNPNLRYSMEDVRDIISKMK